MYKISKPGLYICCSCVILFLKPSFPAWGWQQISCESFAKLCAYAFRIPILLYKWRDFALLLSVPYFVLNVVNKLKFICSINESWWYIFSWKRIGGLGRSVNSLRSHPTTRRFCWDDSTNIGSICLSGTYDIGTGCSDRTNARLYRLGLHLAWTQRKYSSTLGSS